MAQLLPTTHGTDPGFCEGGGGRGGGGGDGVRTNFCLHYLIVIVT